MGLKASHHGVWFLTEVGLLLLGNTEVLGVVDGVTCLKSLSELLEVLVW